MNHRAELLKCVAAATKRGEFTLRSGKKSDFYFDARLVTLDPLGLSYACEELKHNLLGAWTDKITALGGPATAAIPLIAGVGVDLPGGLRKLFYVRGEAKDHGTKRRIEGPPLGPDDNVMLVDDVLTSGTSLLDAYAAVKETGAQVRGAFVLVDRQEGGRVALADAGIPHVYSAFVKDEIFTYLDKVQAPTKGEF